MPIRIIPGAVTTSKIRALMVSSERRTPAVNAVDSNGRRFPAMVRPLSLSTRLGRALRQHDEIRLFELEAAGLSADTRYHFTPTNAADDTDRSHFRTLSRESLRVVLASCYYDGFNRAGHYRAALDTHAKGLHLKILAGDNVYADVWRGQALASDAFEHMAEVYAQHFWRSAYGRVLSAGATLMTWDDHEFWNNFPECQIHLSRTWGRSAKSYALAARECLFNFQAILNDRLGNQSTHLSQTFDAPVVDFFLADVRVQRKLHDAGRGPMMNPTALTELENWARQDTGKPGVLVMGQPLWLPPGNYQDYGPPDFPAEYARIWRALQQSPRDIMVFSGDVHHSRILRVELAGQRDVYEVVSSPASHIPTVSSIAVGGYENQGRGHVSAPSSVQVDAPPGLTIRPKLIEYLFGTSAPNTFAVVDFAKLPSGSVSVDVEMIDLDTNRPATTEPIDFGNTKWYSRYRPTCSRVRICELRARRPA